MAKGQGKTRLIAQSALLCGLSLIILYVASIVPTGQLGMVALSGVLPAAVVMSGGIPAGFLCYGGTGILALILLPNKTNVILYLLFFGLYPMIKSLIEVRYNKAVAWLLKLAFFNLAGLVTWLILKEVLFEYMTIEGLPLGLIWLVGNAVFVIFDLGFSRLIVLYQQRIGQHLK